MIDDTKGHTLAAVSTLSPAVRDALTNNSGANKVCGCVLGGGAKYTRRVARTMLVHNLVQPPRITHTLGNNNTGRSHIGGQGYR